MDLSTAWPTASVAAFSAQPFVYPVRVPLFRITGHFLSSGLTLPSKVAAFLSPLHEGFDPSLMCVKGAALFIAMHMFNIILRRKAPLCADQFQVPTNRQVSHQRHTQKSIRAMRETGRCETIDGRFDLRKRMGIGWHLPRSRDRRPGPWVSPTLHLSSLPLPWPLSRRKHLADPFQTPIGGSGGEMMGRLHSDFDVTSHHDGALLFAIPLLAFG